MDTEEMYQRGVADAERGTPDPFYYQHYYHYRRAYDRTRQRLQQGGNRLQSPVVLALAGAVALLASAFAGGVWWANRNQPVAIAPTVVVASPTPVPATPAPIFPTETPPSPTPIILRVGGTARIVNLEGRRLNARAEPKPGAPVSMSLDEGSVVTLQEGPVESEGYIWWRVEQNGTSGWSAQQSQEGIAWLEPQP